jgi:ArsR family transcriptional regulator, arsenate/arsenite/antimonite-responsive transcriptional repressor
MYAKTTEFNDEQQQLAKYAKLLSHPARIAIIQLLVSKQACISGDIANELPLSRTTVSQHLQELKNAGLINGTIDGVTICYCLNKTEFDKMKRYFESFLNINIQITNQHC